jgi:integrase
MRIIERVAYGERGQGSLVRYEGVATWFSVYCQHGVERRRTTGETDFKAARRAHRRFLDALAAERQGHTPLPALMAARVTVGELLDALEADFRLRGVKWWAQAKYHAAAIREWFDDAKASKLTSADVDRYIESRLGEGHAPASVNRQTGLLAQALRLAHQRGTLTGVIHVRRLPERNARQGFLERVDLEKIVAALPDYLQDFTRFAYLTAWRRGELVSLRWSDVDRDGAVIRLRAEHAKNGHGRTVAIEGDLQAIIERRWQARQVKGRDGTVRVAELVFHRAGRSVGDFRKAWAAACIAAGLAWPKLDAAGQPLVDQHGHPRLVPAKLVHDLRRSGVRNMVRAGVRERIAMEISGHRTRSIFDRYNITSEEDLREAMQRTSEYVNALPTESNVTRLRPAVAAAVGK